MSATVPPFGNASVTAAATLFTSCARNGFCAPPSSYVVARNPAFSTSPLGIGVDGAYAAVASVRLACSSRIVRWVLAG